MIREERLIKMVDYINANEYVSIDELAEYFKTSRATVRRDLNLLNEEKQVSIVRGGAKGELSIKKELLYAEKLSTNREEKIRIAKYAVQQIEEGQMIFLDTGVTIREFIPFLLHKKNIHVITNDIWVAANLMANTEIEVTVAGGDVRRGYYTLRGMSTERFLSQVFVDIAFISMDAIDAEFGCTITNNDEVGVKQIMVAHSEQTVIVADHSKFGHITNWKVCEMLDIDTFITGEELGRERQNMYLDMNLIMV